MHLGSVRLINGRYRADLFLPIDEVHLEAYSVSSGYYAACKIALLLKRLGFGPTIKFYDVDEDTDYVFEGEDDCGF